MVKRKRAVSIKSKAPRKRRKVVTKKASKAKSKVKKTKTKKATAKKTKSKKTTSKKSTKKTKKTKAKKSTPKKSKTKQTKAKKTKAKKSTTKKAKKPMVGRKAAVKGVVMASAVEKNSALASGNVVSPYDLDMSITDAKKNIDKFMRMQIIKAVGNFYFATHWGRNGTKGQSLVKGPFDTQAEAAELMEKKFKAKTGNSWANRADTGPADSSQRKGRGHYELSARLDEAGAKKATDIGSVAVSLMWDHSSPQKRNDLDLWVQCPSGEWIGCGNRRSKCNGVLDVDMREGAPRPVENIVWTENAPKGGYKIEVHNYSWNHRNPVPFQVGIVLDGGKMEIIEKEMPAPTASSGSTPNYRDGCSTRAKEFVNVKSFNL